MQKFVFILFIIVSSLLIISILLQEGKGINKSLSSNSLSIFNVFGPNDGYSSFIIRVTVLLSITFFALNMLLSNINIEKSKKEYSIKKAIQLK